MTLKRSHWIGVVAIVVAVTLLAALIRTSGAGFCPADGNCDFFGRLFHFIADETWIAGAAALPVTFLIILIWHKLTGTSDA